MNKQNEPNTTTAQKNPDFQHISSDPQDKERCYDAIKKFSVAMLITQTNDAQRELRARPMQVARIDDECDIWFATDIKDSKCSEIRDQDHVCVSFQSPNTFVSVSGIATIIRDQAIIDSVWKDSWKTYFPKGQHDPDLHLLRIQTTHAEFWDYSGTNILNYAYEVTKARIKGQRPDPESMGEHCKVDLSHGTTNTPLVS